MAKKGTPHAKQKSAEPHAKCGSKLKSRNGTCSKPAGWRTDHPGQGKCYLHGGATPIRHGRYSSIEREELRAKIERFEKDPDPLNLAPEVALLRTFIEDLMNRWDAIYGPDGALLAWHESFGKKNTKPKPRQLPDFSSISQIVDRLGKMVERIHKMKNEGAITMQTLNRVVEQMGAELVAAIQEIELNEVQASKLFESVERRWNSIRLDRRPGGHSGDSPGPAD